MCGVQVTMLFIVYDESTDVEQIIHDHEDLERSIWYGGVLT
jgi:hypothetical protein